MTVQSPKKELNHIAHLTVAKIKDFKGYGLISQTHVDTGNKEGHRILVNFNSKKPPFNWNKDHDFCERHYDGFGVIDNCPLFDEWLAFAKDTAKEFSKKYGVGVKVDLEGFKYELTLDVEVFKNPARAL